MEASPFGAGRKSASPLVSDIRVPLGKIMVPFG